MTLRSIQSGSSNYDRTVQWLSGLTFVLISAAVFAGAFEVDRYRSFFGDHLGLLTVWDNFLLLWLLWGKSLLLFTPLMLPFGLLVFRGRRYSAWLFLLAGWVALVYWMAADLLVMYVTGRHLSHWLPYLVDMLTAPVKGYGQINWISGRSILRNVLVALTAVVASGVLGLFLIRLGFKGLSRLSPSSVGRGGIVLTAGVWVMGIVGAGFATTSVSQPHLMGNVYQALPIIPAVVEALADSTATVSASIHQPAHDRESIPEKALLGRIDKAAGPLYRETRPAIVAPKPADPNALVPGSARPNVIVLIVESFRYSSVSPDLMKRLDAWSQKGLRLDRHYAGSNVSHFGVFALLYGRTPLKYDITLNHGVAPQLCETFRRSGYRSSFVLSVDYRACQRLDEFVNEKTFDRITVESDYRHNTHEDWPTADRKVLAEVSRIVRDSSDKPQLVCAYLMSTHYPYAYTPEFEIHKPSETQEFVRNWKLVEGPQLFNRYKNSALFMEDELMKFVESLDLERNIVIITGDHGESMREDGWVSHGTRASEIQMRTPFMMVGAGVPRRVVRTATGHTDMLPTLLHLIAGKTVPIAGCDGRDLAAEPEPRNETVVVPLTYFGPHEVLFVRDEERMLFKMSLEKDIARATGFLDVYGRYELKPPAPADPGEADRWIDFFRRTVFTFAGLGGPPGF